MKLATWNVNSIKARQGHVRDWLTAQRPDILMIQELKGLDFPYDSFAEIGYGAHVVAQKSWNGVATLIREDGEEEEEKDRHQCVLDRLPGDDGDEDARYLETQTPDGLRLINIYLPNGNPPDSEKYPKKLAWMDRLYHRLKFLRDETIPFVIGGDFNVIPEPRDCYAPEKWAADALYRIETRRKFRALVNLGLADSYRVFDPGGQTYTFWDYTGGAWPKNEGLRIDHILTSPEMTDRLASCVIDTAPRGLDKPSDHTPLIATFT